MHELVDGGDDVEHVAEAAALRAVAVHRHRRARPRLVDEARNDHPVERHLTRTDRIEEPGDDSGEPV